MSRAFGAVLIGAVCGAALAADPPKDANQAEKDGLAAARKTLADHKAKLPLPIDDVLATLDAEQDFSFDCPDGSAVTRVEVKIRTTLKHFQKTITVDGKDFPIDDSKGKRVGQYWWIRKPVTVQGRVKKITFDNILMLDADALKPNPDSPNSPLPTTFNAALLYHELLHGQLQIDAIKKDPFRKDVCACKDPQLTAVDLGHEKIFDLEQKAIEALSGEGSKVRVMKPTPAKAKDDGSFEIDLGEIDKEQIDSDIRIPEFGNIDGRPTIERRSDGHFVLRGKLKDKTKPGFLVVWIDPPRMLFITGVEESITILPPPAPQSNRRLMFVIIGGIVAIALLLLFLRRRS